MISDMYINLKNKIFKNPDSIVYVIVSDCQTTDVKMGSNFSINVCNVKKKFHQPEII